MPRGSALSDTSPEAEAVQLELWRNKTRAERFEIVRRLTSEMIQNSKRAIRRVHPEFSDEEVNQMFIELHYGKQLADEVREYQRALKEKRTQSQDG
ncbi:MAG: hypothetical protein SGJ20_16205 [Planctomycetota bacterium]|nr:hypothetical protein [Planctomycetota bacterium]